MEISNYLGIGAADFASMRAQANAPQAQAAQAAATPAADMVFGAAQQPETGISDDVARDKATAKVMNDRFAADCQTCKNRRYQDGSDDSSVSFQTPQHIDPGVSASVVSSHEQEHVVNEQAKARQEGGRVVSQSVVLHGANCPECGRYYIAGGTTTTVTKSGGSENAAGNANSGGHSHANEGESMNLSV